MQLIYNKKRIKMPTILKQINIISRCANLYRANSLKNSELGSCHHSYVIAVCRHPGITGEELSKLLCVNKSSVARNLSYLEEHGYIRREQSLSDKRAALCYPTEKLGAELPKVREILDSWNSLITEDLTAKESAEFLRLLDKIAGSARKYAERGMKE